jgi:hypothetical protein
MPEQRLEVLCTERAVIERWHLVSRATLDQLVDCAYEQLVPGRRRGAQRAELSVRQSARRLICRSLTPIVERTSVTAMPISPVTGESRGRHVGAGVHGVGFPRVA